jgi:hypothetical protein
MRNDTQRRANGALECPRRENMLLPFVKEFGKSSFVGGLIRILRSTLGNLSLRYKASTSRDNRAGTNKIASIQSHIGKIKRSVKYLRLTAFDCNPAPSDDNNRQ